MAATIALPPIAGPLLAAPPRAVRDRRSARPRDPQALPHDPVRPPVGIALGLGFPAQRIEREMPHLGQHGDRVQHQPHQRVIPIEPIGIGNNPQGPSLQRTHNLRTLGFVSARNRE